MRKRKEIILTIFFFFFLHNYTHKKNCIFFVFETCFTVYSTVPQCHLSSAHAYYINVNRSR